MPNYVNHDLRVNDGRTLYMPPWVEGEEGWGNLFIPSISRADTLQQYPVGTRYVYGDRSFRYVYVGSSTLSTSTACAYGRIATAGYISVEEAAAQNAKSLVCTVAGGSGVAVDGDIALNELAGGYVSVYDITNSWHTVELLIVGNTATDGGGTCTLTLADELPFAVSDSDACELLGNPYSYTIGGNTPFYMKIGVPIVEATAAQFTWVQTWGPCCLSAQAECGDNTGVKNNKIVIFRHDGAVDELDMTVTTHDQYNSQGQIAGYVMVCKDITGAKSPPWIFLTICP